MAGKLINNELERTCKEADVAQFDVLTSIYWGGLRQTTKTPQPV